MKIYAYPTSDRQMGLVAAKTLEEAKRYHKEAREPTVEELSACIAHAIRLPVVELGRVERYALMADFLGKHRVDEPGILIAVRKPS